eukprot:TRINITY_DN373_c3_g1_i1.p2 TRINITY_DN373_c3_g1~~TRINITY_DN373_c3_g1_i1.p2  ORF type:complete len:113 (-),score=35.48 TRINITY_DN373_c3_g1_i1:1397-1735(-)
MATKFQSCLLPLRRLLVDRVSSDIFGHSIVRSNVQTGRKKLRARLLGEKMQSYYLPEVPDVYNLRLYERHLKNKVYKLTAAKKAKAEENRRKSLQTSTSGVASLGKKKAPPK